MPTRSIGIPGGQAIAGLSGFAIGNYGFGSDGIQEFNDIKTYQVTEKFSLFKGRHAFKFGGRWLHSSQGFSYSGNEGVLGHFNYTGAFTGFAFSDFLLDQGGAEGQGRRHGSLHPAPGPDRHLRPGRLQGAEQPDPEPRPLLGVHLAARREGRPADQHRPDHGADPAGRARTARSRALYDAYYGGFEPRVGFAWTPARNGSSAARSGSSSTWRAPGKNLRLPANPPLLHGRPAELRRHDRARHGRDRLRGRRPVGGGPSTLYRIFAPDLRPQFTKQWNLFVERKLTDSLSAQAGYVGSRSSHMVVPFDFNQPNPGSGDPSTWAPLQQRRPLYPAEPGHRHHQRHELDRCRRLRRPAGQPA